MIGHTFTHFEITAKLGEGGMGEVYRATDTRLGREVAVKVLAEEFLADPERLARFEREAQVLASLDHPGIGRIFGLEEAEGVQALVLELVEGPTLDERIAHGPMPVDEALAVGRQIAEALDAAHGAGIVHRDLKPSNIKVDAEGTVKILDFGLAKTVGTPGALAGGPDLQRTATLTSPAMTELGMVLGTAAYMAPEQARGQEIDRRADIWAFGVVLYEMLTGGHLFAGDTVSDTVAAVLTLEPDWTVVPSQVRRLLRQCLERDPRRRLRDIGDAWLLVEETEAGIGAPTTRRPLAWAAAALLVGLLVGTVAIRWLAPVAEKNAVSFNEAPPEGTRFVTAPVVSPNGRHLAMLVSDAAGKTEVWLRALGAERAMPLGGTEGATVVFWSPDGRQLAFHAAGELRRTEVEGTENQLISSLPVTAGVWSPTGEIIVAVVARGVLAMSPSGGDVRALLTEEGVQYRDLDVVPGGRHLLFQQFAGETGIHAYDLERGDRKLLVEGINSHVRCVAPDLFVYERNRVLLAQRFDAGDMRLVGDPFPVAQDVGSRHFAGSVSGALSLIHGATDTRRLVWFDRRGERIGAIASEGQYTEVYLSPRGSWLMFTRSDPVTGNLDLWVQDTAGTAPNRFTTDPDIDHLAAFSMDDREITWEAHAGGVLNLMRRPASGAAPATVVRAWNRAGGPTDWSPDGRFVLLVSDDGATRRNLWAVPVEGGGEPFTLVKTEFDDVDGRFSPDGRWLAYASDASGQMEIYLQRVDEMRLVGGPQRVSDGGGEQPRWLPDGSELFFLSQGRLMGVEIELGSERPAGVPQELFVLGEPRGDNSYAVSPDGQRILAIVSEGAASRSATVVLDWATDAVER
jgi:Tol biopolymer transport system component